MSVAEAKSLFPSFRRNPIKALRFRVFDNWANAYRVGRHWEIEVEWVAKARYWTVSLSDRRRS